MGEKHIDRYQGLLVPGEGFSFEALAHKGTGSTDAAYTQASPRPGVPDPSRSDGLVLEATGTQSEDGDLELLAQRAGVPGGEEGGIVWRDVAGGDSTSQFKGWDPYQVITDWAPLITTTSTTIWQAWHVDGIHTQDGAALLLTTQSILNGKVRLDKYEPSTSTWTQLDGPTLDYQSSGGALLEMPDGRILLFLEAQTQQQIDVYESDDKGQTWTMFSQRCLSSSMSSNDKNTIRAAYSNGEICLLALDTSTTNALWQFVSDDGGARFDTVDAAWSAASSNAAGVDVEALPSGGFVLTYHDDYTAGAEFYAGRVIANGWQKFEDATAVPLTIYGGGVPDPALPQTATWIDEDGFLYCLYAYRETGGGVSKSLVLMRSTDEGGSWTNIGHTPLTHPTDGALHSFCAVPVAGRLAFTTRWTATGSTYDPYSCAVAWLGGYGTHTVPAATSGAWPGSYGTFSDGGQITYHSSSGGNGNGGQWLPYTTPGSNWAATGAGSFALNAQGDGTVTNAQTFTASTNDTASSCFFEGVVRPVSGGAVLTARLVDNPASASSLYYVRVMLTDAGVLSLYDLNASAAVGTDSTGLATNTYYRIRLALDNSGAVRTWFALRGHVGAWTEGPHGSGLTSTPANVSNAMGWGSAGFGSDLDVKMVGFVFWGDQWSASNSSKLGSSWSNPDSLHARSVPTDPTELTDGVRVRGVSGVAHEGDTWRVKARYDYPLEFAFSEVEPSPVRLWRSSALTEVKLPFRLETETFSHNAGTSYLDNVAIGLVFIGANFETAHLDGWDGAAWHTLGTATASDGFDSLAFTRNGSRVRPAAGTTGAHYLRHGAHVGDTFDLGSGDTGERYRKISHQAEGAWTGSTARTPVLTLDGCDGTEVGSGTGSIWARDFGVIVHDLTHTYEIYRVRIPAQSTADGYLTAKIVLGPVYPFGHQPDQGWSVRKERAFRDVSLSNGRRRRKALGPVRRVLDFGWVDTAVDASRVYGDQATALADYIVPGATAPGASVQDLVSQVEGLIETADGQPVVFLRRVKSGEAAVKLTVRESLVYGRIVSDAQRDNVMGDEVSTPLDRLNTIRIEEEL